MVKFSIIQAIICEKSILPMISLTELAKLEEAFCWSRVEWRIDTIWSADCRVRGSSTPD